MNSTRTEPPTRPRAGRPPAAVWLHALIGAVAVGGISFAIGFFGPMFLQPNSPQGPMLGIFITGPAGFVVGLFGGAIVGIFRRGRDAGALAVALVLGGLAVLSCGIPFVPPLVIVAVPLAAGALILAGRAALRRAPWTPWRVIGLLLAVAPALLAIYLACGRHHLIDWLEGH